MLCVDELLIQKRVILLTTLKLLLQLKQRRLCYVFRSFGFR